MLSINVPVGPSLSIVASFTIGIIPSEAGFALLLKSPTKSVFVEPGSAALICICGRPFAYCNVIIVTADLDELSVKYVQLDVTDDISIQQAYLQIQDREGRLDILINNAGISGGFKKPAD